MPVMTVKVALAVAALIGATEAAQAQTVFPFGSRPFCDSGDRGIGSLPQCSYYTLEQCQASLQGVAHCYANPALAWSGTPRATPGKKQKRRVKKKTAY